MIYDTAKYIDILTKLKITPNQFLFAWLIYNKQWKELQQYMTVFGAFSRAEIDDLENKDVLLNMARHEKNIMPAHLVVTEVFANEMIIAPDDAWEELLEKYPGKVKIKETGQLFASKGLTYSDEKGIKQIYTDLINRNKYLHLEVLAAIEIWKAANNGFATMKIDKFVTGRFWKEIEAERSNYVGPALF